MLLPPEFKSWLYKFASGDATPHFQELLGVKERRWRIADPVLPLEFTSSTSYADLATVGPQLTGLENGTVHGRLRLLHAVAAARARATAGPSTTTRRPLPAPSPEVDIVTEGQAVMFHLVKLSYQDNNKIKLRYRVPVSNGGFSKRWLHAVQVA